MVKKIQKPAVKTGRSSKNSSSGAKDSAASSATALPAGLLDGQFAQSVKDSAQHIWAAGLGAFSKAQGEGGKVFEALVKEGMTLQKKTQSAAEEKLGAMASKMSGMAGDVGNKAGQHWDKLESIFEERVAQALKRLGVPAAKDVAELSARIDALSLAAGLKPIAKKAGKTVAAEPAAAAPAKAATPATAKVAVKRARKASVAAPVAAAAADVFAKPVTKRVIKKKAAAVATTAAAAEAASDQAK